MPYDITYIWKLIYSTKEPFHRKKIVDLENRLVVSKGEREGARAGGGGRAGDWGGRKGGKAFKASR